MNISKLMARITNLTLSLCEKHAELLRNSFIVASLVMFAFNLSSYFASDLEKIDPSKLDKLLATLILTLPIFQIAVLLCLRSNLLRGTLAVIMLLSLVSYHPAWWLYSNGHYGSSYWVIFTAGAAVLVVLSLWVTWLMMRVPCEASGGEGWQPDKKLGLFKDEISQQSFQTVCFFLTLFLSVTFAMSLAFALDDKYEQTKGCRALCAMPSPSDASTTDGHVAQSGTATLESQPPPVLIRFEPGRAEVQAMPVKEVRDGDADAVLKSKNYASIEEIGKIFKSALEKESNLRIILAGHTDSSDVGNSKRYKSNYELSDARARFVYLYLAKRFDLRNVSEWAAIPLADENNFWAADPKISGDRRSVEVWIEADGIQSARLNNASFFCSASTSLNDYLYFTLYTITTTGLGDIRPVRSEAKFMASACNIFEVFFLIIFFNVLIASRRQQLPEELSAEIGRFRGLIARLALLLDDKNGDETN